MAAQFGAGAQLVEYGAGALRKVRLLLDAIPRDSVQFVPVDISGPTCWPPATRWPPTTPAWPSSRWWRTSPARTAAALPRRQPPRGFLPRLQHRQLHARRGRRLPAPGGQRAGRRRAAGRHRPGEGPRHLARRLQRRGGRDRQPSTSTCWSAQRELGAAFPADGFEHLAFYNPAYRRVEMHLRAARPLALRLGRETYLFGQGETLHTENSHKYTVEGFQAMAARAGFGRARCGRKPLVRRAVAGGAARRLRED
jgi:hypothetical protein